MGFKKKHMALGLVAIMVVVMTSACTLTGKAAGESLKTNDISDGEVVSGQAVSGSVVSETDGEKVNEWLELDLPKGYEIGEFDDHIGYMGGALIYPISYNAERSESASEEWKHSGLISRIMAKNTSVTFFDGIPNMEGVPIDNHTDAKYIAPIVLDGSTDQWSAIVLKENHDLYTAPEIEELKAEGIDVDDTDQIELYSEYWTFWFVKEGEDTYYVLKLSAKEFSEEEAVKVALSASIKNKGNKDSSELELQEEAPSVSVSSSDMIGADMPEIIYNDANRLIVSCWKGVFVYDKNEHKIIRSLDRVALKCDCTQGDMYTSVHASNDGKYVYLDCEYYELQYQFDVDNSKLEKLEYKEDRWKTTDFFNSYGDWFKEDTTDVAWYTDPKGEKIYTNLVHMDCNLMCVGYYESKEFAPTEEFPDPIHPRYIFTDEYTPQIDKKDELTKDDYSCWADICLDRIEGDTLIGHYSASTYKVYRYNVAMGNVCGFGSTEVYVKINSKTVFKIFDGKKDKEGHQKATKVSEKRFREYIKKHNNPGEPSYGIYDPEDPEHSTATRPGGPAYGGLRFGIETEKGKCVSVEQLHQA